MHRVVIRDPEFEAELMLLGPGARWADEFLAAVEWLLARDPEVGFSYGNEIWSLDTAEFTLAEPLTVFYTFDEATVTLMAIRKITYEEL